MAVARQWQSMAIENVMACRNCQEIDKMDVEKLISLIQSQPILYDRRHNGYQNFLKKAKIWENIAIEMNESSEVLRTKWKGLKDSYKKYQRQTEDLTGGKSTNCSRYNKWCWAENLQFLESCGYKRSKSSRVRINSASLHDCSLDSELPPEIQLVSTTSIPTTPPLETEIVYLESLETLPKDTVPKPMPVRTPRSTTATDTARFSEPTSSFKWRPSSAKRSYCKPADEGDRIYLKRSKLVEPSQAIDLLFQSYAETFKSLSSKKQVLLKIKLAKLFADAELDEMNEPSVVFSSASVTDEHCAFGVGIDLETMKHSPDSDLSSID